MRDCYARGGREERERMRDKKTGRQKWRQTNGVRNTQTEKQRGREKLLNCSPDSKTFLLFPWPTLTYVLTDESCN